MNESVIFLTDANSHKGGGVFDVVCQLGKALYDKKVDLKITWHEDDQANLDKKYFYNIPLVSYKINASFPLKLIGYSCDLTDKIESLNSSVLHLHGLWTYHSCVANVIKKRYSNTKVVITPHGMLDPWAVKNSHWKKKIAGLLFEDKNLQNADCIHALNLSEYESIRAYGLKNPVAIIPNGFNIPEGVEYDRNKEKKVLLFIGRIHPKKGIAELLESLNIVKESNSDMLSHWQIRIAGWDQLGHTDELKAKCEDYGLNDFVSFIGPVLGKDKERELCKADAFVLTSFSEGLPMSVLEAWAYRLPVVMTDQCNLPDGFEDNAAIRVTTASQSIAEGLEQLFSMSDAERTAIGENGYELVKRDYTWDGIADKTIQLYQWLLKGGEKPEFVMVD